MSLSDALSLVNAGLLVLILLGLFVQRRASIAYSFVLYAVAVVITTVLMRIWPERFFVWAFYIPAQILQDFLKLALAMELAMLIFMAFPVAARGTRAAMLLLCIAVLVVVLRTLAAPETAALLNAKRSWVIDGTAIIFTAIFINALWYRIPLHPWHKAILSGFIPYLLLFTIATDLFRRYEFQSANAVFGRMSTWGYLLLMIYWNIVAWQTPRPPPGDPVTIARIQPWLTRTGGMW